MTPGGSSPRAAALAAGLPGQGGGPRLTPIFCKSAIVLPLWQFTHGLTAWREFANEAFFFANWHILQT